MNISGTHRLTYQAARRDFEFLLWEQHRLQDAGLLDRDAADALLNRVAAFCEGPMAHSYRESDEQEAALGEDGRVRTPDSFPALLAEYRELWKSWQGGDPSAESNTNEMIQNLVVEMLVGANPAFVTYVGFNGPAQKLLAAYGSEALQSAWGPALRSLDSSACLCITERQAGSDLSLLEAHAVRGNDGQYVLHGHKWLISAGMHDLTGNICYFVLARTGEKQRGMLGLSCFLVPRWRLDEQGLPSVDNGIRCREVARKMGLRGCANTHLDFSAGGHPTVAYLLGTGEGRGLQQLMMMMTPARISTGIYALGMAACAYSVASRYAQGRIQGKRFDQAMNGKAESQPISRHPDVERMRLDMLAVTSGCRALLARLALCQILQRNAATGDEDRHAAGDLLDVLLPIVKAYTSDQAWRVTETAIQTMGGVGYLRDYPVEQNARDCKILSIWEGTNHMQALFLIRDKLGMCLRPAKLTTLQAQIAVTLQRLGALGGFATEIALTEQTLQAALEASNAIGAAVRQGQMNRVPDHACEFLSGLAELAIAWQLLDAAGVAQAALLGQPDPDDAAFYDDKIRAARHFVNRRLPQAAAVLGIVRRGLIDASSRVEAGLGVTAS